MKPNICIPPKSAPKPDIFTSDERDTITGVLARLNRPCNCGSAIVDDVIGAVLERAESHTDENATEGNSFYDPLDDAPAEWGEFAAHILDAADLLDHGSSIGWAWLTEDGQLFLKFLRYYGTQEEWPGWVWE